MLQEQRAAKHVFFFNALHTLHTTMPALNELNGGKQKFWERWIHTHILTVLLAHSCMLGLLISTQFVCLSSNLSSLFINMEMYIVPFIHVASPPPPLLFHSFSNKNKKKLILGQLHSAATTNGPYLCFHTQLLPAGKSPHTVDSPRRPNSTTLPKTDLSVRPR